MRLRRVEPYGPGFRRIRRGRGFSYHCADGSRLDDPEGLERIHALAIPPAWRDVWICERANGHIQAVGVDAAGRRQYLYHEQWRSERDEEKFERVVEMAKSLPRVRERVSADLDGRGLGRRRVEAVALRLLDRGVFRVGGEEYALENGTQGVATLLRSQVQVEGDHVDFDFVAKGGVRRREGIDDRQLAKPIRALLRSRSDSERLLSYRVGTQYRDLHADDINVRLAELADCSCTAKDFRTWHATVLAASAFAVADRPESARKRKAVESGVFDEVATALDNTPTVARNSYVDPRIIQAYRHGDTIARALRRASAMRDDDQRNVVDRAVVRLLGRTRRG